MDFFTKAMNLYRVMLTKQYDVFPQIKLTLYNRDGTVHRELTVCLERLSNTQAEYVYHIMCERQSSSRYRMNSMTHRVDYLDLVLIHRELSNIVAAMTLSPLSYAICNITCKLFKIHLEAPILLRELIYQLTYCRADPKIIQANKMMTVCFENLLL